MKYRIYTLSLLFAVAAGTTVVPSLNTRSLDVDACPGYNAKNIKKTANTLTADLQLAGKGCNIYGADIAELRLEVTYDDDSRIHVKILDPHNQRYEVPEFVFPRPSSTPNQQSSRSRIRFDITPSPFSFAVVRRSNDETLFDTKDHPLVFENQYLRVKTSLPAKANIYGLGEHSETLRLDERNTTRTMWAGDFGIPRGLNLYGVHPVYIEHRTTGSHGVFLLNSNGMDIKLRADEATGTSLEYNVIGGVLDFYFFAGPSPADVSRQYAQVAGLPAMTPYWNLGFHQCRWGYRDAFDLAEVIANYSKAEIPLETLWTDIDYMNNRWIFTVDEGNFPLESMRQVVDYLHEHDQHYMMMVDPAVAYTDYPTFHRGVESGVFLKEENGTIYKAVVWPGVSAYPDFMHLNASAWWTNEFKLFFNPETGIDIDGLWIDMNEPTNFCDYPCVDPEQTAIDRGMPPAAPPVRAPPRELPGFPFTQQQKSKAKRQEVEENLTYPPYDIANGWPSISDRTAATDIVHANGIAEYDAHNLYGSMMSVVSREAMLARRPGLRPVIITRSTFAGAGAKVFKWLGDNTSIWGNYRDSIAHMLGFASIYQIPVVGSDVCGFAGNTTETLCARWATLGAFYPFYRNHNLQGSVPQEFYRWESVAQAARKAISIRYRLLDYMYTALQLQHTTGTPALNPLFFAYPQDENTFGVDMQFLYGPYLLVSPVTAENATSVDIYLPKDIFYDFESLAPVQGAGKNVTLEDVGFDSIPLHIRGGGIIPLRSESAMTTTELRTKDFELVVAPGMDNRAEGSLYLDDGVSIEQQATVDVWFAYFRGVLKATGDFGFDSGISVKTVKFLGVDKKPRKVTVNDRALDGGDVTYDAETKVLVVVTSLPLTEGFEIRL
ncbi:alpha-glucosidase [Morchella snyderi]|nr:alpha-glucosidase [Morchella snyderi]